MTTTSKASKHIKSSLNTRKRIESSSKNTTSNTPISSPPTSDEELYEDYIMPHKRPLNRYDRKINDINKRAVKALRDNNKELFTEIVLGTKSLYVRDDAVRVAAEVGWIDVAERLLIKETDASYQYPVWHAPLSIVFVQFGNPRDIRNPRGRRLLQTAVLSAVKRNREDAFNLLAPIVGVDFTDICGWDPIEFMFTSQMDLEAKKKWLDLIIKYIDQNTSHPCLENALRNCAWFQLVEHIPHLLSCLLSTSKAPFLKIMTKLTVAIDNNRLEAAYCIIDEFKKASIPVADSDVMCAAVNIKNIDMVLYLYQNGCHSFSLRSYGERSAQRLHSLLSEHNREDIYSSIIVG